MDYQANEFEINDTEMIETETEKDSRVI